MISILALIIRSIFRIIFALLLILSCAIFIFLMSIDYMNSQKPIPAIRTEVSGRVTLVEVVKDKSGRLDEVKFKIDSNDEILHYYGYDPGANAVAASLSVGDEVKIIYAERLSNHDFWGITIGDVEVMNPQLSFEERKRKGKSLLFAVLSFTLVTLYTFVHFIKLRLQTA